VSSGSSSPVAIGDRQDSLPVGNELHRRRFIRETAAVLLRLLKQLDARGLYGVVAGRLRGDGPERGLEVK
jgi:hypothetical protein